MDNIVASGESFHKAICFEGTVAVTVLLSTVPSKMVILRPLVRTRGYFFFFEIIHPGGAPPPSLLFKKLSQLQSRGFYPVDIYVQMNCGKEITKGESCKRNQNLAWLVWRRTLCRISLDDSGVVRTTQGTFVVEPMESWPTFSLTVVTKYILEQSRNDGKYTWGMWKNETGIRRVVYLAPVPVFLRKLFCSQQTIKHAKIHLQKWNIALAIYWTGEKGKRLYDLISSRTVSRIGCPKLKWSIIWNVPSIYLFQNEILETYRVLGHPTD